MFLLSAKISLVIVYLYYLGKRNSSFKMYVFVFEYI